MMSYDFRGLMAIGIPEWCRPKNLNPGFFLRPALWFTPNTLAVVGIDAVLAQDILFALRAAGNQERGVADAWLRALQCAQLAHDRLLRDLRDVDRNLSFWQSQVSAGGVWSHGAFMLLSRGPLSFAEDVAGAAKGLATRRLLPLLKTLSPAQLQAPARATADLNQQQQQPRQDSSEGGLQRAERTRSSLTPSPSCSSSSSPEESSASATDMMQQRVLLLRELRVRLARALAELTQAAGHLRVGDQLLAAPAPGHLPYRTATTGTAVADSASVGFAAAAAAVAAGRLLPSPTAWKQDDQEDLVVKAVEDAVRTAVRGMTAAIEGLLSYAGHDLPKRPVRPFSGELDDRLIFLELQDLFDLLRLQPYAVQALGLATEPARLLAAAEVAIAESAASYSSVAAATAVPPPAAAAFRQPATTAEPAGDSSSGTSSSRPMGLHLMSGGGSAAAALSAARKAAALAGPLIPLPATARMPSRWKRHWLRYCAATGLMLYGGMYLVRHSRLAGSDDLDRWILTAVSAVRSALRTHVVEPLAAVRDELFRTFRDRPDIVSPQDFSLSRESLLRMLADFAKDHQNHNYTSTSPTTTTTPPSSSATADGSSSTSISGSGSCQAPQDSTAAATGTAVAPLSNDGFGAVGASGSGVSDGVTDGEDEAVAAGMAVLMRSYEVELRNPLRNLILGDLARALLIQVQHVKVDGEAAMLRLDQILRANELSLSLMAALPALGISVAVVVGTARLLIPRAPDPKRAAVPSRLAMASLERTLSQLAAAEEKRQQQQQQLLQQQDDNEAAVGAAAATAVVEELRGLVVYRLYRVYSEVTALYAAADRTSRFSEWRQLYDDLLALAAPAPSRELLATHQRMMRTYSVFQR